MGRFRLLYVLVFALGLLGPQAAAAGVEETEFSVRVTTPVYEINPDGIVVPGYVLNQQPGAPALPLYGTVIELPASGDWALDVTTAGSQSLAERVTVRAALTPAYPAPSALPANRLDENDVTAIEAPDPAIYSRNALYPQAVAVAGTEQWQRGKRLVPVQVFPFQYNPVTHEVVYHPDITVTLRVSGSSQPAPLLSADDVQGAAQADADELGALWVRTNQRGMHRLNYADVSKLGLPAASLKPANFLMTYLGQPVQIQVTGADDGAFDPPNPNVPGDPGDLVIFYAQPYIGRWMATNAYRFSCGANPAPASTRMTTRAVAATGAEPVVTKVNQVQRVELNKQYIFTFLIPTEADHIFDLTLTADSATPVNTRVYDLALDDPVMAGNMTITGLLYGGAAQAANPDEWVKVQINNHDAGVYTWDGYTPYAMPATTAPMTWLDGSPNQLKLVVDKAQLPTLSSYSIVPDWLEIAYPANADAENDRMEIQDFGVTGSSVHFDVTGFSSSAVKVYDVRDPRNPVQLLTTNHTASLLSFWDAWQTGAAKPAYSLSTDAALLTPASVTNDKPSSWKTPNHTADYIAIVNASLWDAVQPLLDRRAAQGIHVAKVDVQDIYDEFNSGLLDQNAIRDFLKYAYQNWNQGGAPPKYVVLVGDATPDYKQQLGYSLQNLVPAFLINIDPWMVETAADNRFVTFDGPNDYLPEMTIGRIPAQTPADVANYVAKVADYEDGTKAPDGDWQSRVVYVADDDQNEAGNFHQMSDSVRATLPARYQSSTVYYNPNNVPPGGYQTPADMKTNIRKAFDDSAVFLQWFGHASKFRWGSVSMWNILDVPGLAANKKLPFVAGFSCVEGYFINLENNYQTQAETHLLQAGRGSIAGLSPSGKHVGSALTILDQGLTNAIFQDRKGVIGDAADAARLYYFANSRDGYGNVIYADVIDTSVLFGDPVLKLRLPVPLSVPDAPAISITRSGATGAGIAWEHVGPDAAYYEVYRSTQPYPVIGVAPTNQVKELPAGPAYGIGSPFGWTDTGVDQYPADGTVGPVQPVGDVNTNYFWVVQSRSSSAQTSGYWNIVGEFDFALTRGN